MLAAFPTRRSAPAANTTIKAIKSRFILFALHVSQTRSSFDSPCYGCAPKVVKLISWMPPGPWSVFPEVIRALPHGRATMGPSAPNASSWIRTKNQFNRRRAGDRVVRQIRNVERFRTEMRQPSVADRRMTLARPLQGREHAVFFVPVVAWRRLISPVADARNILFG